MRALLLPLLFAVLGGLQPMFAATSPQQSPATTNAVDWRARSPWSEPAFFPIAVWLQSPANAPRYRSAGINCYIALWHGPTEEQLAALKKAGMRLICSQNEVARKHLGDTNIIAWMHGDEPDNAQSLGEGRGWGPPVPPDKIVADYERLRAADPSRPVVLNLGQGVAWDRWYGRGVRSNHPEDYPLYLRGCDIASFDIYPVVHDKSEVAGKLWMVADGVKRLVQWTANRKPVWNCIECTHISNPDRKASPAQVKSEVWMSLIHGSRGLIYFVHQFKPTFREAALLDDPEMLEAVTAINRQITELAPVLNSPTHTNLIAVDSSNAGVPIAAISKSSAGSTYIFAAAMRDGATSAKIRLQTPRAFSKATVLGENRGIPVKDNMFSDDFSSWAVHLYKLEP